MPSYTFARFVISGVSSLGVAKIVAEVIKNNTVAVTTSQKLLVNAGSIVLGSMIVEQASNHVNNTIDQIIEWRRQEKENSGSTPSETV